MCKNNKTTIQLRIKIENILQNLLSHPLIKRLDSIRNSLWSKFNIFITLVIGSFLQPVLNWLGETNYGAWLSKEFLNVKNSSYIEFFMIMVIFWACYKDNGSNELSELREERDSLNKKCITYHKQIQYLKSKNQDLKLIMTTNAKELVDGWLYAVSKTLNLNSTDRITIYMHSNNQFVSFGRYSANNKYGEQSKQSYSDKKGVIADAWENGISYANNLSDYKNKNQYNYTDDEIKNMNMKSKCMLGYRIDNIDKSLGVIIVESTEKDKFTREELQKHFDERRDSYTAFIIKIKPFVIIRSNNDEHLDEEENIQLLESKND